MPIDERMTSMYVFANLGIVAAMFARPSTSTGQVMLDALPAFLRRRLAKLGTERAGVAIVVLGLIPMGIDGFTQLFRVNNYESTPLARVLTGGLAGFGGGLLGAAMLVTIRQFSIEMQALQARYPPAPASGRSDRPRRARPSPGANYFPPDSRPDGSRQRGGSLR